MPPSDRKPLIRQSSGPQEVCPDQRRGRLDTADISSGPWRTRIETRMERDGDTKPLITATVCLARPLQSAMSLCLC